MAGLFGDTLFYLLPVRDESQLPRRAAIKAALTEAGATVIGRAAMHLRENAPRAVRIACDPYTTAETEPTQARAAGRAGACVSRHAR